VSRKWSWFSDEEEVVVAVDAATPWYRVNGRCTSIYLPVGTAPSPFFDQQQDLVDTSGKTAEASNLMRGQLIRPKDRFLPEGTPAKWQEGPAGCKEAGLSTKTVIRGEWKDCSVWEWIGW
jgi:hypothetical protein